MEFKKKMLKQLIILLSCLALVILILPLASAAMSIACNTDGSINIKGAKNKGELWAQKKGGDDPYFPVSGKWKGYDDMIGIIKVRRYKFESNEGLFVQGEPTKYILKLKKKLYTITCPPFIFACNILNTTIESCYLRNDTFYAKFFIENIPLFGKKVLRFGNPYGFEYKVWLDNDMIYSRTPKKYRDEFKDILITQKKLKKGNKYKFVWDTANVSAGIERFGMVYDCEKGDFFREAYCKDMPSCRYNGDCLGKEYCEKETCQELDCEECEYIEEHKCKKHECCDSSVCSAEEECSDNKCVELSCTESEVVQEHQCISLGCKDDEYTFNHICVKLECEGYETAVKHQCEILKCNEDEYIENHECKKLDCRWYEKPLAHDCVNLMYYKMYKSKESKEE